MLKVGPTEVERHQVIAALRAGQSFKEATAELRKTVEPDWFERNEEHLQEVAEAVPAEPKAPKSTKATKATKGSKE